MDSEILLRLLPKEYEYKINNIKILGRSTILEEQQLKANFVVNICDKAQACLFSISEELQSWTDVSIQFLKKVIGKSKSRFSFLKSRDLDLFNLLNEPSLFFVHECQQS